MLLCELFEDRSDFPNITSSHAKWYDDESGLFMNAPNQWSKSPYLGAVSTKSGKFIAQMHIPQSVWRDVIQDNPKWQNSKLPDSFLKDTGKLRQALRSPVFSDPRQAAWLSQSVLYGHEDVAELIDDFLTLQYIDGKSGISAWGNILKGMPNFDGTPLQLADAEEWETRNKPSMSEKTERYTKLMITKIKDAIKTASNAIKRKLFGNPNISGERMNNAIDAAIEKFGIESFVTVPGSLKVDLNKVPKLVTESNVAIPAVYRGYPITVDKISPPMGKSFWEATMDDEAGEITAPRGEGATPEEALNDIKWQIDEL